jgi:hypothetical protein
MCNALTQACPTPNMLNVPATLTLPNMVNITKCHYNTLSCYLYQIQ